MRNTNTISFDSFLKEAVYVTVHFGGPFCASDLKVIWGIGFLDFGKIIRHLNSIVNSCKTKVISHIDEFCPTLFLLAILVTAIDETFYCGLTSNYCI